MINIKILAINKLFILITLIITSFIVAYPSYAGVRTEIPFNINKVPSIWKNKFFISSQTGGACPIGERSKWFGLTSEPIFSTHVQSIEITISKGVGGDLTYMKVCAAPKGDREKFLKDINEAIYITEKGVEPGGVNVEQKINAYEVTYEIPCVEFAGGKCPTKGEKTSLVRYVARIYQFGLMIVGLAAFGAIVFGSIKYILAAGDIGSTQDAKEWITQAIWGLLLLLGAYIILYTINPQLVSLREPQREILSTEELSRQYQQELEAANQNQNIFTQDEGAAGKTKPPQVPCENFVRLNVGGNINLPFIGNQSVTPLEHCDCPDGYEPIGGTSVYCKLIPE